MKENQILHARVTALEQEKTMTTSKAVEELEQKISELEFAAKERELVALKNTDLEDELLQQKNQMELLKEVSDKAMSKALHDSASSLADELDNANKVTIDEKNELEVKLDNLQQKMSAQKAVLPSNLFQLKEKELKEKRECNCKTKLFRGKKKFCRINHFRFNWKIYLQKI